LNRPPATDKVTPAAWYALLLVSLTNLMSLLDRNILAILAPSIKADLNIGDAELGLLYGTVFALFYALFSLPLGRLADGWMRQKLLAIAIAFWSFATGLAAFAQGFALLCLSRLGVGIGEGATTPAGTSLLFDHFPPRRRGLVMAIVAAAIALGLGGSSVLGGFAANWWDVRFAEGNAPIGLRGWQFAFLVACLPGFVLAVLLWRLREPVRGAMDGIVSQPDPHPFRASWGVLGSVLPGTNWVSLWRRAATPRDWMGNLGALILIVLLMMLATRWTSAFSPRPPLDIGGAAVNPHALQWAVVGFGLYVVVNLLQGLRLADRPVFVVLAKSPSVVMVLGVASLQMMINYGVMGFTPSFIMSRYGESLTDTALVFGSLSAAIGILGPMISGPVSDKLSERFHNRGRISITLLSLGLSPVIAFWVYTAPDATSFYFRFVFYSLVLTQWLPPLYATLYDLVLPRMRGMTASTYIILSTILGLGVGPYAVGMVSDARGGDLSYAILSVNVVAPFIVVMLVALLFRVRRDAASMVELARAAGEQVVTVEAADVTSALSVVEPDNPGKPSDEPARTDG
jgi:MFS transporter, Spinster family, sphingosine-1-phosphate transporter